MMINNFNQALVLIVLACTFIACESKPDANSYEYQVEQFVVQAKTAYADTSQLVAYNELTDFADSLKHASVSSIALTLTNGEELILGDIKMPILLETFASWCSPCVSSLPALNQLAEEYKGRVQFIIITQESKDTFKNEKYSISDQIKLAHTNDDFKSSNIIYLASGNFQSVLPFPSMYFINQQQEISAVKIGAPRVGTFGDIQYTKEDVYQQNIASISDELEAILHPE